MLTDHISREVVRAARANAIDPAALLAVVEIESAGRPLEADGKTPRLLFERHVFFRELNVRAPHRLGLAVSQGLAHKDWRRDTQYKDQGSSAARLALLARAREVDTDCAHRSCSWGLGQTMGFLAEELGFGNATVLLAFMAEGGLPAQIDLMVREIRRKRLRGRSLLAALNDHDWETFAEGYNGPGFRQNRYDTKLAAAYASWSGRVPEPDQPGAVAEGSIAFGELSERVADLQRALARLGYPVGEVDGDFGNQTRDAVMAFQRDNGLPPTGSADRRTLEALAGTRPLGETAQGQPSPGGTTTSPPTPPILSPIDDLLGGKALAGFKTLLAVLAYVVIRLLEIYGTMETGGATASILTTLVTAFGGLGVLAKVDRATKALVVLATVAPRQTAGTALAGPPR